MDEFKISHQSMMNGIGRLFEQTEKSYPEPKYQGLLAQLREQVEKFCNSKVPQNFDEFIQLSQAHTMMLSAINFTNNSLLRMKLSG